MEPMRPTSEILLTYTLFIGKVCKFTHYSWEKCVSC